MAKRRSRRKRHRGTLPRPRCKEVPLRRGSAGPQHDEEARERIQTAVLWVAGQVLSRLVRYAWDELTRTSWSLFSDGRGQ